MQTLSDLPTERAASDVSKRKITPAVVKVIQTMAMYKQELVRSMRLIEIRERTHNRAIEVIRNADKTIYDWLKENPSYTVDLHVKE